MAALTNVKGTSYTGYNTGGIANLVTYNWGQGLKAVYDEYTVPAGDTVAVSTSLYLGRVPKGARVVGFIFTQSGAGAAAVGGIKVGSTAATATTTLTDMTAATAQFVPALTGVSMVPTTAESDITILLTDAADLDAATKVSLTTLYIIDPS